MQRRVRKRLILQQISRTWEFSHAAHQKGELAQEITGVEGAEIKLAVLKTPGGHKIELLEYLAPADRKRVSLRPCDVGSVHVALIVDDLESDFERYQRVRLEGCW
jgi:hypothetical protein